MQVQNWLHQYQEEAKPHYEAVFQVWREKSRIAGAIPLQMIEQLADLYPRGKQLRGALSVLGYELAGGTDKAAMLKASVVLELLETSVLALDDVLDNDDVRRGVPTLHRQWESLAKSGKRKVKSGGAENDECRMTNGEKDSEFRIQNPEEGNRNAKYLPVDATHQALQAGEIRNTEIPSQVSSLKSQVSAQKLGYDMAVLSSSVVGFNLALWVLATTNFKAELIQKALELYSETIIYTGFGEALDIWPGTCGGDNQLSMINDQGNLKSKTQNERTKEHKNIKTPSHSASWQSMAGRQEHKNTETQKSQDIQQLNKLTIEQWNHERRQLSQKIHEYKTIWYSAVLPLKFGAILAGQTDKQWLRALEQYARALGSVFQIQDDILGSFGDSKVTGKANDQDIKEGRWTVLVELLYQSVKNKDRVQLEQWLGKAQRSDEEIEQLKEMMQKYGVVKLAQAKAQQQVEKGQKVIPKLTSDPAQPQLLSALLEFVLKRTH